MTQASGFLKNKRALILGLATEHSLAFGIGQAFKEQGASIALTYQNERLKSRVEKVGKAWDACAVLPADLSIDADIDRLFESIKKIWPTGFDIIVHSVAYAPKSLLEGDYLDQVTREGFQIAHDISSYTFAALAKKAKPLMENRPSSLLTLSYLGSQQVIPNYNVMGLAKASLEANVRYMANSLGPSGIRVNAISAGPVRTLAASGIQGLRAMLHHHRNHAPLRQNVTLAQIGSTAAFLCSDLASGITGDVIHVDAGYHIMGMGHPS